MRYSGRSRLAAWAVGAVAALAVVPIPAAAGSPPPETCHVSNRTAVPHSYYTSLQAAVDDATAGDVLRVRGQCHGHTDIDRDLTIRGQKTDLYGKPILSGYDTVQVLHVGSGVNLTLKGLTIRDGLADDFYPEDQGGGISNEGTLTLKRVIVRGNHSAHGGGGIANQGTLSLYGRTVVKNNHADSNNGGGIENANASLTMNGRSTVRRNSADSGGGVNLYQSALVMNDSSTIHDNGPGNGLVRDECGSSVTGAVDGGNVYGNSPTDIVDDCHP